MYFNWTYQVYKSTYLQPFCDELVDYGDKLVQMGYKTSYTPENFLSDISKAASLATAIAHSGPGITEEASKEWLMTVEKFYQISPDGHFTVRCVVFPDPSKLTI